MSADLNPRRRLRGLGAAALYHLGALRVLQSVSRSCEVSAIPGRRFPRLRRVSSAKFVILCYHRVASGGFPFISSVTPQAFEAQMRFLRERYRVLSLEELCREMENPAAIGQAVAVTFDDGYRDLYTNAFAILKKYGIPATVFLIVNSIETGRVAWYDKIFLATHVYSGKKLEVELDQPRQFELTSSASRQRAAVEIVATLRRLPDERRRECCLALEQLVELPGQELAERMLTWDQVREMQQGGVSFGSHTLTHPVVSRVPVAAAGKELRESKRIMEERLGRPVKDFAYPFGQPADCGFAAEAVLHDCGYRSAMTTSRGINLPGADRYRLRRVQIGEERSLALFAARLNQLFLSAGENGSGMKVPLRPAPRGTAAENVEQSIAL